MFDNDNNSNSNSNDNSGDDNSNSNDDDNSATQGIGQSQSTTQWSTIDLFILNKWKYYYWILNSNNTILQPIFFNYATLINIFIISLLSFVIANV